MANWETAIAARDAVFLHLALITSLAYLVYRQTHWRGLPLAGIGLFVVLLIGSVANMVLWKL